MHSSLLRYLVVAVVSAVVVVGPGADEGVLRGLGLEVVGARRHHRRRVQRHSAARRCGRLGKLIGMLSLFEITIFST